MREICVNGVVCIMRIGTDVYDESQSEWPTVTEIWQTKSINIFVKTGALQLKCVRFFLKFRGFVVYAIVSVKL